MSLGRASSAPAVALVIALCTSGLAVTANAQESEARAHFRRGQRAYEQHRFEEAVREFEAALAITERPTIHYNLFRAYGELGDVRQAANHLRIYLPNAPAAERPALEERLARMEASPGARGAAQTTAPPPEEPQPAAEAAPEPVVESIATPPATASSSASVSRESRSPDLVPAIISYSAGVVGVATFAILGSMAQGRVNDLRATCAPACDLGRVDEARTWAAVADVGLVVGIAGVALGTGLLVHALSTSSEPTEPQVSAFTDGRSLYVNVRGRL